MPPHERAIRVFYFMKSLKEAVKEYFYSLTFSKKSKLVWTGTHYCVSYFYSESTLKRLGWEVII